MEASMPDIFSYQIHIFFHYPTTPEGIWGITDDLWPALSVHPYPRPLSLLHQVAFFDVVIPVLFCLSHLLASVTVPCSMFFFKTWCSGDVCAEHLCLHFGLGDQWSNLLRDICDAQQSSVAFNAGTGKLRLDFLIRLPNFYKLYMQYICNPTFPQ